MEKQLPNIYGPGITSLKRKNGEKLPRRSTSKAISLMVGLSVVGALAPQFHI